MSLHNITGVDNPRHVPLAHGCLSGYAPRRTSPLVPIAACVAVAVLVAFAYALGRAGL